MRKGATFALARVMLFSVAGGILLAGCAGSGLPVGSDSAAKEHGTATSDRTPAGYTATYPRDPFHAVPATPRGQKPTQPDTETPARSDQHLLDTALEFCQASTDYWERGELDDALAALDHAYSLILQIDNNAEEEILQQRDDIRITISRRIIEIYSSRFIAANGLHTAIPLVKNKHVEKEIAYLTAKDNPFFVNAYRRSGRYRPMIVKKLKEAGLPEELSWLPLIESGFKVRAFSRARALGLWQFIASTGYKFGLQRDRWIDERMDPAKSTDAAIAYLTELHRIFGDWTTALAAYNCGEGAVLRYISSQQINYLDNFWDLYEKLPRETAAYVPRFLAVLQILRNPEAYGIELPDLDPPVAIETVTIEKQLHLKTIAENIDIPYDTMTELNPELRHNTTPQRPYELKVPTGKGSELLAKLGDIPVWCPPAPARSTYVRHRVRKGETLSLIARRYGTSVQRIKSLNHIRNSNYIVVGTTLKVPTSVRYASRAAATSRAPCKIDKRNYVEYVVKKGDSLYRLARTFDTTTSMIQSMNGLKTSVLQIGQVLMIPKGAGSSSGGLTATYTVLKGDSPFVIARRYGMNLSDFLTLNKLTPRSTIFPGQTLLVTVN